MDNPKASEWTVPRISVYNKIIFEVEPCPMDHLNFIVLAHTSNSFGMTITILGSSQYISREITINAKETCRRTHLRRDHKLQFS